MDFFRKKYAEQVGQGDDGDEGVGQLRKAWESIQNRGIEDVMGDIACSQQCSQRNTCIFFGDVYIILYASIKQSNTTKNAL